MYSQISTLTTELFLLSTGIILLLSFGFTLFIIYYQKTRLNHQREKELQEYRHQRRLLEYRLKDKEQILGKVARDMHDNVANKASLLNMKIVRLIKINQDNIAGQLTEVRELTGELLTEIKAVSHSLNTDRINQISLTDAIDEELKRMHNLGFQTELTSSGTVFTLPGDRKILVYRIAQEALGNARKHAGAGKIAIDLAYTKEQLTMTITDDGKGFDSDDANPRHSTGLLNMQQNADSLGGDYHLETAAGKGTKITLTINRNEHS